MVRAVTLAMLLLPAVAGAGVIDKLGVSAVALTFDACEMQAPSYFDEKILSYLVREEIPSTIFMTGKFAVRNSERLRGLAKLPFVEIENHSFSHCRHMENLPDAEVRSEVSKLDDLMAKMIGKRTRYFRFPGGHHDERVSRIVEEMGYKIVHWSFPSGDADRKVTPEKLAQWVTSKCRAGSVLIFHINGRGFSTGDALPGIVHALRSRGMRFVKLEEGGL